MASASVQLDLAIHAAVGKKYVAFIRRHLPMAHALLSPALCELSLAMVGDRAMADLHVQFMGIEGPTDVLTFPLEHDDGGNVVSGEVVICVPEAARQAKERKITVEFELLLYALHGMLHLCGFDDKTAPGFRMMHKKEDEILTRIGLGPIFAVPGSAGRDGPTGKKSRASGRLRSPGTGEHSRKVGAR